MKVGGKAVPGAMSIGKARLYECTSGIRGRQNG
jgi:hypothetical protein